MVNLNLDYLLKKIRVNYFWMFLTEKCNLDCDYCFYKNRNLKTTISFNNISLLLEKIKDAPYMPEFIISGGEPLMEWGLVKRIAKYIRGNFESPYILIQTNGILLDKEKMKLIKNNNMSLEFGIDGGFLSTNRHRKGTGKRAYGKILKSIRNSVDLGINTSSTLTVHPKEAKDMFRNFLFLSKLGLGSVEITPAAFEMWGDEEVDIFKKEYIKALEYASASKRDIISDVYDRAIYKPFLDLVVMANGMVMSNWSFLSLPVKSRENYSILTMENNKASINKANLKFLLKLHSKFFNSGAVTYRDYSTLYAEIVYREMGMEQFYKNYRRLCDFLKTANRLKVLRNDKVRR